MRTVFVFITLSSAALLSGAFFLTGTLQTLWMILIMMVTPLLSNSTHRHTVFNRQYIPAYSVCGAALFFMVVLGTLSVQQVIQQLIYAALPEEAYFRLFLTGALGMSLQANVLSSLFFSIIHGIARDWLVAISVFIPSLILGSIYIKYRDLSLVVLVHLLFNLIYITYIDQHLKPYL